MDSNDPDLQAFESNLRQIFWERELGKAAALVPNPERLAWPESHTENRGGGFAKE